MFRVALTLDVEHPDRPTTDGVAGRILDALTLADVRTTIFFQGRWVQANPATARAFAAAGHLVGNHSHFHARMPMLSRRGLSSDVSAATAAIRDAVGVDAHPWFRCPFGAIDTRGEVLKGLARLGYRNVGWHADARDWAARGPRAVTRRAIEGTRRHGDGAVVLMHGWPWPTPVALPGIIAALRDEGAEFVTIADLPELPVFPGWDTRAGTETGSERGGMI